MESLGKIAQKRIVPTARPKADSHLHSPAHLLADELANRFSDKKHFGFYLKMATLYDHGFLRSLAGQVMEGTGIKTPGKLFAFLIKKNNLEKSKTKQ